MLAPRGNFRRTQDGPSEPRCIVPCHRAAPSGIHRQALTLEKPLGASLSAHESPGPSSSLPPGEGVTWAMPPPSLSQALFLLCFSLHELITDSMSDNENSDLSDGYSACRRLDWNAQCLLHEAGHTPPTPQRTRCTLARCGKWAAEAWFSPGHPAGTLSAGWPHPPLAPTGRPVPPSLSSGTWSPP